MKYEIGIGELALGDGVRKIPNNQKLFVEIDEHQIDVTECDASLIDEYLKNLQNGAMGAKTFNKQMFQEYSFL